LRCIKTSRDAKFITKKNLFTGKTTLNNYRMPFENRTDALGGLPTNLGNSDTQMTLLAGFSRLLLMPLKPEA